MNAAQQEAVRLTPEEARVVERLRDYRGDLKSYAGQCLRIVSKDSTLVPLVLNPPQMLVHAKVEAQRQEKGMVRVIVLKGRKQGVSTYIGARFYAQTRLWRYRNAKVMAHVQDSTDALFAMVRTFYDNDPLRLRADTSNAKRFAFSNGSSYTVATAGGSGEAGRGDTPTLAHLSEVAFYKNAEKNFAGFANSVPLAPGTEVFVESTANGIGNEFHRRWMRAEAGLSDGEGSVGVAYAPIFIPWFLSQEYRMPVEPGFSLRGEAEGDGLPSEREIAEMFGLDMPQMAWRRFMAHEQLGSVEVFMREYPCSPSEAFRSTGTDLFIAPLLVMRARSHQDILPQGPRILGVDPAGQGGDRFCMALRQGNVLLWYRSRVGVDPGEAIHWVAAVAGDEKADRVCIDNGGGWGASLLSGIRTHYPQLADRCYPVDFGGRSQFKAARPHMPGPKNRRAEMYMRLRDWFGMDEGVSIPDDDELQSDLGAITAVMGGQSTDTVIASKAEIRRVLRRSCDVSDAVALTFAFPDRVVETAETQTSSAWITPPDAFRPVGDYGGSTGWDSGGGWMV